VPEPAQGVADMARVVAPGGTVAAYAWDMEGGGFPYQRVNETPGRCRPGHSHAAQCQLLPP
jgi:hypothetical protein